MKKRKSSEELDFMERIALKTKYLTYEIACNGLNHAFTTADGENRLLAGPTAVIVNNDGTEALSVKASLSDGTLDLCFDDGTVCSLAVKESEKYITFTVKSISREDFLYISFLNVSLSERVGDYEAVMMGMTAATRMEEHPGDNPSLSHPLILI